MKKKILFLMFAVMMFSYSQEVVRLTTGSWEPFTSSEDAEGRIVENIITEAFKLEGVEIEISYFPWKRAEVSAQKEYDGVFPYVKTAEREELFYFSKEPVLTDSNVFFHMKDLDFKWSKLEELKNYKIGGTIGYESYLSIFRENNIKVDVVKSDELNYKKLLGKRIQIFPNSLYVGYYQINKMFDPAKASLFTNNAKGLNEVDYFLMLNKNNSKNKDLMQKFDKGLEKLRKTGRYQKIIDKGLGID